QAKPATCSITSSGLVTSTEKIGCSMDRAGSEVAVLQLAAMAHGQVQPRDGGADGGGDQRGTPRVVRDVAGAQAGVLARGALRGGSAVRHAGAQVLHGAG